MVLALLGAVLLAGVATTVYFERRDGGGATVPSVVVVDAPLIDAAGVEALQARFADLRGAGDAPNALFGPFDAEIVARLVERGHRAAAFVLSADDVPTVRDAGWQSVVSEFPRPASRRLSREAFTRLSSFVTAQDTTRPFVVGIALDDQGQGNLGQLLEPLVSALDGLPWFRRSSLVIVTGAWNEGRRPLYRLDRGRAPAKPVDGLEDLLDPRW